MPRTHRQEILRKHTSAKAALDKAANHVQDLMNMFEGPHPKYAEGYKNILLMIVTAREFLESIQRYV